MEFKRLLEEKNRLEILKSRDELTQEGLEILSELTQALQLQQTGVMRSCSHNCTTNYCNSDGSYSHKMCDDCGDVIWD